MKQQFLDLNGLTELVTYLKKSITEQKEILPYASNKLFPSTGNVNCIYIDTATNSIYRWDSSNKKYEILAKAVKSVSISESTENGKITLTVDGVKTTVPIHGLKSAAYTESSAYATAAQGVKAESAVQSISLASGTNKGTVKLTVDGKATDNIAVKGLGSAAYTASSAYATAGHTHTKAQIGLGNVDNTADKDKSVKHATTADNATTAGSATTTTNVSGENATGDTARHVWFSRSDSETKRVYNDNFKYNPATNLLTTNITGSAASANSVAWTGVTGKPSTFTPSAHKHDDSTITSLNASKLFGTIDIARLPHGALERCVIVTDDDARFKLTTADVQLGDTVKVDKTKTMYFIINESKLNSEEGYTVYTAGTATSVPWSGVTGKPSTFTPSSHTHPYLSALSVSGRTITYTKGDGTTGTITTQDTWRGIQNNLTSDSTSDSLSAAQGKVLKGLVDGKLSLSGGILTGRLTIKGDAANSPLVVRGIAGYDGNGNIGPLYLQYQTNNVIYLGNTAAYNISADGSLYSGTAANAKAVPWTGISGKPSAYPPADHSHAYLPLSGGTMTGSIFISDTNSIYQNQRSTSNYTVAINWRTNSKGWYYDDNGTSKKYAYDPQIGQHNTGGSDGTGSICILPYATNAQPWQQNVGLFIAKNILKLDGNVVLHSANYNSYAPTKTGTGASGTWGISVTGNAATATKLTTARSINGTNFDGSGNITTATWGTARNMTIGSTKKSVNGGADVSWSLSEIGAAAASHSHSYLPLSGGTLTGTAMITWPDSGNWNKGNANVTFPVIRGGLSWDGQSDGIQLYAVETQHDNLELYLKFTDDNSNGLSIRNKNNTQTARISATGEITASKFVGTLSGTASKATQTKAMEEIQLNKTAITTYLDINANVHRSTEQGEMNLYRFFAKDDEANYSKTYGLPAVDNHALVFSIDGGAVYERIIDLDIRSNEIYTKAKLNNSWGGWVKLLNSSNYSSYAIPLSGSTVSNPNASNFSLSKAMTGNLLFANTGDTNGVALGIGGVNGANDGWAIRGYQTSQNRGCLEIAVGDDGDEGIYVRQYTSGQYKLPFMNKAGSASGLTYREIVLMEPGTGNSIFPGTVTATTFKGSLSGNASSATALTSSAGSTTQPVYFSGGKPVACSYTLGKSVPADAKFTDTNTWRGIQNNLTSAATDQSLSAAQGKALNEKKMGAVSANGFYGLARPDGNTSDWIRTTTNGIIPTQSGSRGSGHSALGTDSWYFNVSYIDHMYSTDVKIADKVLLQYDSTNACLNFVFS